MIGKRVLGENNEGTQLTVEPHKFGGVVVAVSQRKRVWLDEGAIAGLYDFLHDLQDERDAIGRGTT